MVKQDVDSALKESTAKWKIVVGHHTIKSSGHHGNTHELNLQLLPILQVIYYLIIFLISMFADNIKLIKLINSWNFIISYFVGSKLTNFVKKKKTFILSCVSRKTKLIFTLMGMTIAWNASVAPRGTKFLKYIAHSQV